MTEEEIRALVAQLAANGGLLEADPYAPPNHAASPIVGIQSNPIKDEYMAQNRNYVQRVSPTRPDMDIMMRMNRVLDDVVRGHR